MKPDKQAQANRAVSAFLDTLKDCGFTPLQVRRAFEPYWVALKPNSVRLREIASDAANNDRSGGLSADVLREYHDILREEEATVAQPSQERDATGCPSSYRARPSDPDLNPVSVKDLSASASPATKEQQ